MSWEFALGERVICIRATRSCPEETTEFHGLVEGAIYEIEGIAPGKDWFQDDDGCLALWVSGASATWLGLAWPIASDRFKPVRTSAIDIFRSIAQGVTDGKPVVPDPDAPVSVPDEWVMPEFIGRPILFGIDLGRVQRGEG